MHKDPVATARACYQAYVAKDRDAVEALISDHFHFTSPLDNRIDRATYFARCWPNSQTIVGFNFIYLAGDGERVFVTYEAQTTSGRHFRNTEGPLSLRGIELDLHVIFHRRDSAASSRMFAGESVPHDNGRLFGTDLPGLFLDHAL